MRPQHSTMLYIPEDVVGIVGNEEEGGNQGGRRDQYHVERVVQFPRPVRDTPARDT